MHYLITNTNNYFKSRAQTEGLWEFFLTVPIYYIFSLVVVANFLAYIDIVKFTGRGSLIGDSHMALPFFIGMFYKLSLSFYAWPKTLCTYHKDEYGIPLLSLRWKIIRGVILVVWFFLSAYTSITLGNGKFI